jgi:hypothetical protein
MALPPARAEMIGRQSTMRSVVLLGPDEGVIKTVKCTAPLSSPESVRRRFLAKRMVAGQKTGTTLFATCVGPVFAVRAVVGSAAGYHEISDVGGSGGDWRARQASFAKATAPCLRTPAGASRAIDARAKAGARQDSNLRPPA